MTIFTAAVLVQEVRLDRLFWFSPAVSSWKNARHLLLGKRCAPSADFDQPTEGGGGHKLRNDEWAQEASAGMACVSRGTQAENLTQTCQLNIVSPLRKMKQLFDSDQCSEMAKYYAKLTRKYLLNPVAHRLSKALKLSVWNLRAILQRITVSFFKKYFNKI